MMKNTLASSYEAELVEDITAVLYFFTARMYGKRKTSHHKIDTALKTLQ